MVIAAGGLKGQDFSSTYEQALEQWKRSRTREEFVRTAERFRELQTHPQVGDMKANCLFWEGESWYGAGEYWRALVLFEKVLLYPNSHKEEDARYKVGMCYVRLGKKLEAKRELDLFLKVYPQSRHSPKVKDLLKRFSSP
ncbi:MAG: tetratricopeptide repeat protein [bacterium]